MKVRVKGQTAMEYLMTYGWAILIVIVVIAALYSMGVFTISPGVPCSPCFSYFAFVDYADGTLKIRNGPQTINVSYENYTAETGRDVSVYNFTDVAICNYTDPCTSGDDIVIEDIATTEDVDIIIYYTVVDSGLLHSDTGTIHNI